MVAYTEKIGKVNNKIKFYTHIWCFLRFLRLLVLSLFGGEDRQALDRFINSDVEGILEWN